MEHPITPLLIKETMNNITLKEVIRIDNEGFHYKGQFIADAGEAHRLMVAFLKQHTIAEDNNDN